MKVSFYLKNPKEGKNTILLRARAGRAVDVSMATRETVNLKDWDEKNQCLLEEYTEFKNGKWGQKRDAETKRKIEENKKVNYRLMEMRKTIEEAYKTADEKVNRDWVKNLIYPEVEELEVLPTLLDYFDVFTESRGTTISKRYKSKINSIKAIMSRYMKYRGIKTMYLTDVNNDFKNDFEKYCLEIEQYSINYFEKNFQFIKTVLNHARKNGYEVYYGLNYIKCRTEKTQFVILTGKELESIKKESFTEDHLETAKDWLLISCYCGQRVSDFMRFNVNMITERIIKGKKRYFIDFTQMKTKKQMHLLLSHEIIEILQKRNWSFPRVMSTQKYNKHIKEVCELAKINELVEGSLAEKSNSDYIKSRKKNNRRKVKGMFPKHQLITSHIGRRSFASNNFGTIPTPLLMYATGHSSPAMLMKYIGQIDQQQSITLAEYL